MKVGFTGTRNGLEYKQGKSLMLVLNSLVIDEAHHGDCVGADSDFHDLVISYKIVIHPPIDDSLRAYRWPGIILEPKTYLARNRDIVNSTDILIACPPTNEEIKTGGTWYTINYTRKNKKPLIIILPNGTVLRENYEI